jgi:hypothetical protein
MNALMIVLRLPHVVGGVFWVGTAIFTRFFLVPSVTATAESGQVFMRHLTTKTGLTQRVTLAAYLTVLSGAILYWIDSQAFTSSWQISGAGVGFGLGALAGLVGFGFGQIVGRNATLIGKLGSEIQGKPTPEQIAALDQARRKMSSASAVSTAFLIASLVLMATARHWSLGFMSPALHWLFYY